MKTQTMLLLGGAAVAAYFYAKKRGLLAAPVATTVAPTFAATPSMAMQAAPGVQVIVNQPPDDGDDGDRAGWAWGPATILTGALGRRGGGHGHGGHGGHGHGGHH